MSIRPMAFAAAAALLTGSLVTLAPTSTVHAQPLPADYSGSSHGDALSVNLTAVGIDVNGTLAHSATATDSNGDPRAHAESSNLEAGAIGIPVDVATGEANADNTVPSDAYDVGLGEVDVPGVLDTGLIEGIGEANWAGDFACVADGTPIAQSTTSMAGAELGLELLGVALNILDLGAVDTSGQTTLDAGSVVTTSSGNITSLSLINSLVGVEVLTNPTMTATSNGTTGTVSANDYEIAVTLPGADPVIIGAGGSIPIELTVAGLLNVNLTLSVGEINDTTTGATASGDMTFLRVAGNITDLLGTELASVDLGLLPLSATATGAPGGVECDALIPPVITTPTNGDTTSETPTIAGTGVPGATVTVTDGTGNVLGTAVVDETGNWSFVADPPLDPGDYTITATQELGTAVSGPSDPVTFTVVDTTPPDPPVITSPTEGEVTSNPTPTITGTGEPGATVEVTIDGAVVGTAEVAPDGTWNLPLIDPLPDGEHTVTATQTDAAGNTSGLSDPVNFIVDTVAPDPPVITGPTDGSTIGNDTPTITGTGEPGATVEVTIDGTVVGTAEVGPDGTWSLPLTDPLPDGEHTVTATQTDPAGNLSGPSEPVTFTVDTTAEAPVIEAPVSGDVTNDDTPTISGTGEPGSTVTVTDQDGNELGTAEVAADGTWSFDSVPLADGTYTITATQTDAAGNTSDPSTPVTFTVDVTASPPPIIESPTEGEATNDTTPTISGTGEPGATVEVVVDGVVVGTADVDPDGNWSLELADPLAEGGHTVTATQTDAAGNISDPATPVNFTVDTTAPDPPVITGPADGSTVGTATPTITGTGEIGATVEVTIDGTVVGSAEVGPDGTWSLPLTDPLPDGDHTVTATQTDAAGNTSDPSAPSTFTVDTTAPAPPAIEAPVSGSSTSDPTPTISGTGEPGSTVTVTDQDGNELGTADVAADGTWSFDSVALADGDYTITATQTDAAGNVSPESDAVIFTVDTAVPDPPVITSPTDGESVSTTTPTITGTGEPGATVAVTIDGTVVGTAEVDPEGNWSLPLTDPLPEGEHTVTATQTDAAGNTSDPSAPVTFEVDTTVPDPPIIESPTEGEATNDTTPTISGTGESGATVEVTVDGTVVGTAEVDPDGNWSLDLTAPLAEGEHTVTATQTDPAGNTSDPSVPVNFTVDLTAPDPPVITGPADGSTIGTDTPTITGTGEIGATVEVTVDGTFVGTAEVGPDGTWSLALTEPLDEGEHTITATQTDPAGNVSDPSAPVSFIVDTTVEAPVIDEPVSGSSITNPTPTIGGTGEAGSTVTITDQDDNVLGTAEVDGDGNWSFDSVPLADGTYTVTATQTDPDDNVSGESNSVIFTVDTVAPDPPAITGPGEGEEINTPTPTIEGTGEPGATVEVTVDGAVVGTVEVDPEGNWSLELTDPLDDGAHTVTATQTDAAGNVSDPSEEVSFVVDTIIDPPVITSPADGETLAEPISTIEGTGEPGATVTVEVDGEPVGTATVDADGNWSLELDEPLGDGEHTITATQTDPAGNTSDPSEEITVTVVDSIPPDPPQVASPTEGETVDTTTPTIEGTGESGATVEITISGEVAGQIHVDADGNWTFTPAEPIDCGLTSISATQTDPAGNTSDPSGTITFTITCGVGGGDGDGDSDGDGKGSGPIKGPLAITGTPIDLALITLLAALAVLLGMGLARRRRRV